MCCGVIPGFPAMEVSVEKIPYLPQAGNLGSIYMFFVDDKKITNGQLIFQDYSKLLISTVNFKTLKQMKTCF